jgi:hypothetical protein
MMLKKPRLLSPRKLNLLKKLRKRRKMNTSELRSKKKSTDNLSFKNRLERKQNLFQFKRKKIKLKPNYLLMLKKKLTN